MVDGKKYEIIRDVLVTWYDDNKKEYPWRTTKNLYQILITEILLQKTIASNVNNMYDGFFKKYKDFSAIHDANIEVLQSDIKSLGLSNKRSKILKALSKMALNKYNSEIPEDPELLKEVNGIADYVSNAYACFGLNNRTLFFDVNIKRIVKRILGIPNQKVKKGFIEEQLDKLVPNKDCKQFYWALLDFGSQICAKKNPKCEICPISNFCNYFFNINHHSL